MSHAGPHADASARPSTGGEPDAPPTWRDVIGAYVGLTKLTAADLGEQFVVASEQSNEKALAIALMEVKWRLLDVKIARPQIQRALETGREPWLPDSVALGDGPAELPPVGYVPPETAP